MGIIRVILTSSNTWKNWCPAGLDNEKGAVLMPDLSLRTPRILRWTPQLHPVVKFLFNLIRPGSLPSNWRHKTFVGNSSQCKALCDYRIFALVQSSGSWSQQHMRSPGCALKIVHCLGPVPRAATQNLGTSSEVMHLSVLPCPIGKVRGRLGWMSRAMVRMHEMSSYV